jgi:hypothetical protein
MERDFPVQAEAVTHPVQERAHDHFWLSVFASNPAHVPRAAGFGQAIFQRGKSKIRLKAKVGS